MFRISITAALASATLAALIFFVLRSALPAYWLRTVVSATLFGAGLAAAVRYGPAAIRALHRGHSGPEALVVAVFALAACHLLDTAWVIARASPLFPRELTPPILPTAIAWVMAWALLVALAAPDTRRLPWRSIGIFGMGATLGFVLLAAVPP